jgi:hypothetical protein
MSCNLNELQPGGNMIRLKDRYFPNTTPGMQPGGDRNSQGETS